MKPHLAATTMTKSAVAQFVRYAGGYHNAPECGCVTIMIAATYKRLCHNSFVANRVALHAKKVDLFNCYFNFCSISRPLGQSIILRRLNGTASQSFTDGWINVSSTKLLIVNQCVSSSPSKIRPMVRVEYKGQASLPFVEAKPIAAGRAGWGALILQEKVL